MLKNGLLEGLLCLYKDKNLRSNVQNPRSHTKCTCEKISSCQWSKDMIQATLNLQINDLSRKDNIEYIKDRVCLKSEQKVYCCNGEPPTNSVLRDLKNEGNSDFKPITTSKPSRPSTAATIRPITFKPRVSNNYRVNIKICSCTFNPTQK